MHVAASDRLKNSIDAHQKSLGVLAFSNLVAVSEGDLNGEPTLKGQAKSWFEAVFRIFCLRDAFQKSSHA